MALVAESVAERVRIPGVTLRRLPDVRCELAAVTADPPHGELVHRFVSALTSAPPALRIAARP
jgi:hypothetical protein